MDSNPNQLKKTVVLSILFIVPLLFFLFLASGKVNFNKLPIITENISNLKGEIPLRHKVTVLSVLGENTSIESYQNILNLYQVIYKSTAKYKEFQVLTIVPETATNRVNELKAELEKVGAIDLPKWKFVTLSALDINLLVDSFEIKSIEYDVKDGFENVFIIDEELNLRGRTDDEDSDSGMMFSYDTGSVSVLKNKLREDLKVVFYESKFAVKETKLN